MIFIFYFFVLQFQILGFILDLQNFPFRTHSPQYNIWTNSRIFIFYVFLSCPSSLFMLFSYLNWVSLLIWCAIKIIRLSCSCRWGGGGYNFFVVRSKNRNDLQLNFKLACRRSTVEKMSTYIFPWIWSWFRTGF